MFLQSIGDKELYIGSTINLRKRLTEHNTGKVHSTKSRKSFKLVYYEAYVAEEDARERDRQLKLRGQARTQLKRRIHNSLLLDQS